MPRESTIYLLKYGMIEEIKYILDLKKTHKRTAITCIQPFVHFWSPVASWQLPQVSQGAAQGQVKSGGLLRIYSTHT